MPMSHAYCNKLIQRLEECRYKKILDWIRPDGKVQVTVEYKKMEGYIKPIRIHTVLISVQHNPSVTRETIHSDLAKHVIEHVIPTKWLINTKYVLNPSESFVIGGPTGDAGLTGRKIIADTYGGWGGHGGGAFSGKDPSKVDRSAAYAARWIAKNLVANKFCNRVMVQVAYGIGISKPLSVYVDSYGTVAQGIRVDNVGFTDRDLQDILKRNFDLRPGIIVRDLNLKRPIYRKTASGGHFGRTDPDFTWEQIKDLSHEHKKKHW
jgi:S-adenosylmethionine synthetase